MQIMKKQKAIVSDIHNYVVIGETGSGKSEVAMNLALAEASQGRPIHFFDLDQTKPLFRSRDVKETLIQNGITFHYEEQFYDAPTLVGGISEKLQNKECCCILDVGGNEVGSRAIGGFASIINNIDCTVFFVINPYRPWSKTLNAIDKTLGAVLRVSGVTSFQIICNPNIGYSTSASEVLQGIEEVNVQLEGRAVIDLVTVQESLVHEVADDISQPVFPLKIFMSYPWSEG